MILQLPYYVDAKGQVASATVELVLALSLAMQKREELMPFVRRSDEHPTAISRIAWPIIVKRAFDTERVLFFDPTGLLGEKMTTPVQPNFALDMAYTRLQEGESFNSDLMRLAQIYSDLGTATFTSHVVTMFSGLGESLTRESALPTSLNWGNTPPISEDHLEQVQNEETALLSWLSHFNNEESKLDQLLRDLREIGSRRLEYYELQKNKALKLLNEEIGSLEPQINQQIGTLRSQYEMVQQQKNAVLQRSKNLEDQILDLQKEQAKYTGKAPQMANYYQETIRRTREEIQYLAQQTANNDDEAMEELSARTLLFKRPLIILEQQRQQAEYQWQQLINSEKELIKTLTNIFQEARQSFNLAAKELLARSRVIGADFPQTTQVEIPFMVLRLSNNMSSRYVVLPPANLKPSGQITSFISGLVGNMSLPISNRDPIWDEMARIIEENLNSKQLSLELYQMLQANDVMQQPGFWNSITDGLNSIRSIALLNDRNMDQLSAQIEKIKENATGASSKE